MSASDDPNMKKGLELSLAGDHDRAIDAFEDVLRRFPDDPSALKELGLAFARRAESKLPAVLKERGAAVEETDADLLGTLGGAVHAALGLAVLHAAKLTNRTDWIVRYREDFRKSIDALTVAAAKFDAIGAPDAEVQYVLSHCLRYLGRADEARDCAQRAVAIAPGVAAYADRARLIDSLAEHVGRASAEKPTWADLVLPAKTKRELRQMQLMLEDPSLAHSLGVEPPTGLLLYGPPGTGKTTIARVLASEARCRFFATSPAEINSMWLGESEKQVKRLFDQARSAAPSIIFLDEIDAMLPSRAGGVGMYSDKIVNQFLHEMDGLKANRGIFVVGATNRRDMLDPALLRGGRLSREIEIPLPDPPGRKALFDLYLQGTNVSEEVDSQALSERAEDFSGATIRAVINEAGLQALIRIAEAAEGGSALAQSRQVTMDDFDVAFANFSTAKHEPPASAFDTFRKLIG